MKRLSFVSPFVFFSLCSSATLNASTLSIPISRFDQQQLIGWEEKSFKGDTHYSFQKVDEVSCLKAEAQSSASGWFIEQRIDLKHTPYLNWSWWAGNQLTGINEREKSGDDYVARVYVVIDGGWKIWATKALNYVWSSNQDTNSEWNNAFVGENAKMFALKGKEDVVGRWYDEKRNVYQDLIAFYGDQGSAEANEAAYRYIDAVALMTDTDNSEGQATACYGNLIFTAE